MTRVGLALVLALLGCTEPTAISPRPAVPVTVGQRQTNSYSIEAADQTIYVTLSEMRSEGEPVNAFMRRMFASADSAGAHRLVIDLRSITGSDARLLVPLIKGIATRDRFVRGGGLYLVAGPRSFSHAQNAATLLQQYAHPIFVAAH